MWSALHVWQKKNKFVPDEFMDSGCAADNFKMKTGVTQGEFDNIVLLVFCVFVMVFGSFKDA